MKNMVKSIIIIMVLSFAGTSYAGIDEDVNCYCEKKWGTDYRMQVYCRNKILKGGRELSTIINQYKGNHDIEVVIIRARNKWYPQYDMVVYTIKKQIKAYNQLRR